MEGKGVSEKEKDYRMRCRFGGEYSAWKVGNG
jgi:hypothetical protein